MNFLFSRLGLLRGILAGSYVQNKETMAQQLLVPDIATKKATFAMACFWSPESQFGCTLGIIRTRVGFSGGTTKNPTYRNLGDHIEAVDLDYDPQQTDFESLLQIFWENHDYTACNKRQYMSAIFTHDEEQRRLAEISLQDRSKKSARPIQTQILPATQFYNAENYHQKYILQKYPWLLSSLGIEPDDIIGSHVCARLNGYLGGFGTLEQFQKEWPLLGLLPKQVEYVSKILAEGEFFADC